MNVPNHSRQQPPMHIVFLDRDTLSPGTRLRRPAFNHTWAEHGATAAADVAARTPAPAPRKPFATLFAAFMEEKNIRWGELVSGVLIVGC